MKNCKIDFNKAHEIQERRQEHFYSPGWQIERKNSPDNIQIYKILHRKCISLKYVRAILDPNPFKST